MIITDMNHRGMVMDKKDIPNYHNAKCCETCTFRIRKKYDNMLSFSWDEYEWVSICQRYDVEICDTSICDSYQKSERGFDSE